MALMLNLDDAMDVLLKEQFIKEGYLDDDGRAECVRNELEQKCYLLGDKNTYKRILELMDELTSENIIYHIIDHKSFKDWCNDFRNTLCGYIKMLNVRPDWCPLMEAPTKKGHWIGNELGECSVCGHKGCGSDIWNGCKNTYCPNCGAYLTDIR